MNADELAKGLSKNQIYGDDYGLFNRRIQNMLRQQQAEIESMKNPIMQAISQAFEPAKTLTDEEIKQVMSKFYSYNPRLLEFARAILRKAQEK
jgi:hypothetical protein